MKYDDDRRQWRKICICKRSREEEQEDLAIILVKDEHYQATKQWERAIPKSSDLRTGWEHTLTPLRVSEWDGNEARGGKNESEEEDDRE